MLFGLCFFHASIQELHFAYLCILFVTFEYIAFATSSLGTSLYSTSFLQRQTVWSPLLLPSQACRSFPSAISRFSFWFQIFQQLMYSMSVLGLFQHNIAVPNLSWCQERCTYGPLGWNIPSLRHVFTFTNMTSLCIHHKLWLIPSEDCLQRIAKIYIYRCQGSLQGSLCGIPPGTNSLRQTDRFVWCSSGPCGNFECAEHSPHVKSGAAKHISSVCDYFFEPKPLSCEDVSGRKRCGSICSIEIHCSRGA